MTTAEPRARLFTMQFGLITFGALTYFTAYAMLLPTLSEFVVSELGRGEVAVGVAGGAFAFTALLMRVWAGRLGDRHGRRILVIVGASIATVSVLGLALAQNMVVLVVLRLVTGIGEALVFVGAVTAISDIAPPERRGEAVSLFSVSLYLGIASGPALGEAVFGRWSFDAAFVVAAVLNAVTVIAAWVTHETLPPAERRPRARGRVLHPAGLFPGIVMFTSVFGFAGYTSFLRLYVPDVGIEGTRYVLLMYGAILVAIRLFGARIPDRFGIERVGRVGLALSAIGLALMGGWRAAAGLLAGTAIFAVGQALAFPAFMALAAGSAPPAERAAATGTMTAFIDLGFGVGPIVMGAIAGAWSEPDAFLGAAVIAVGGLALQVALGRRFLPARAGITGRAAG